MPLEKINDIKSLLPTHLIPNELLLKMDKKKFFGEQAEKIEKEYINIDNSINAGSNVNSSRNAVVEANPIQHKIEKYKDFFIILKDDLRKNVDRNIIITREIQEIEEERQYYLDKINNVLKFCKDKIEKRNEDTDISTIQDLEDITKLIVHVPEDFK